MDDNALLMAAYDDEVTRRPSGWRRAIGIQTTIAGMLLALCIVIWGLTSPGGYFWPIWPALGLALPIGFQLALREALTTPRRWRALAVHGSIAGVLTAMEVFIWAVTGGGYFWPIWPALGFGSAIGFHALIQAQSKSASERELTERVDVLTRTRRGALDVQAAELRRIERDLHDGAQARLVALTMKLGRAEGRLDEHPEVAELVRAARADATAAIGELRDLARGIAPPVLADRGLPAAVDALGRRAAIPVSVSTRIERRLPPVVETAAYFVVAESLTNVAKHAPGASAHVSLGEEHGSLVIEVSDDGPGGANAQGGGLSGLRQRVQALDGILAISSDPGEGTIIRAELPCE